MLILLLLQQLTIGTYFICNVDFERGINVFFVWMILFHRLLLLVYVFVYYRRRYILFNIYDFTTEYYIGCIFLVMLRVVVRVAWFLRFKFSVVFLYDLFEKGFQNSLIFSLSRLVSRIVLLKVRKEWSCISRL